MEQTKIAPVEKTVTVPATPARAFEIWTEKMGDWWPGERHSVSAGRGAVPRDLVFEAEEGGAIYEITEDGTRSDWGQVTLWRPGERFEMTWHPGEGAEAATHLAVAFEAVEAGCLVRLTHSGWEALGDGGAARRDGYDSGWIRVMDRFAEALR